MSKKSLNSDPSFQPGPGGGKTVPVDFSKPPAAKGGAGQCCRMS